MKHLSHGQRLEKDAFSHHHRNKCSSRKVLWKLWHSQGVVKVCVLTVVIVRIPLYTPPYQRPHAQVMAVESNMWPVNITSGLDGIFGSEKGAKEPNATESQWVFDVYMLKLLRPDSTCLWTKVWVHFKFGWIASFLSERAVVHIFSNQKSLFLWWYIEWTQLCHPHTLALLLHRQLW